MKALSGTTIACLVTGVKLISAARTRSQGGDDRISLANVKVWSILCATFRWPIIDHTEKYIPSSSGSPVSKGTSRRGTGAACAFFVVRSIEVFVLFSALSRFRGFPGLPPSLIYLLLSSFLLSSLYWSFPGVARISFAVSSSLRWSKCMHSC